jgi:hypothetical protein
VELNDGRRIVGESGGELGDISTPKSQAEVDQKFRGAAEEHLGKSRADRVLERLWSLESMSSIDEIPELFVAE